MTADQALLDRRKLRDVGLDVHIYVLELADLLAVDVHKQLAMPIGVGDGRLLPIRLLFTRPRTREPCERLTRAVIRQPPENPEQPALERERELADADPTLLGLWRLLIVDRRPHPFKQLSILPRQSEPPEINWASAEIQHGKLTVELGESPSNDRRRHFDGVVRLSQQGTESWGAVTLSKSRITVADAVASQHPSHPKGSPATRRTTGDAAAAAGHRIACADVVGGDGGRRGGGDRDRGRVAECVRGRARLAIVVKTQRAALARAVATVVLPASP
jgi:hypothetical protein